LGKLKKIREMCVLELAWESNNPHIYTFLGQAALV